MAGFDPALGSNAPAVLLDNAKRLDELVNSDKSTVPDRAGVDLDTWRGMMAKNDEIRQNLVPLSKQYMTLEAAQADIANIPDGSTTYVRSPDGSALAIEYINNSGTLTATGRRMISKDYVDEQYESINSKIFELPQSAIPYAAGVQFTNGSVAPFMNSDGRLLYLDENGEEKLVAPASDIYLSPYAEIPDYVLPDGSVCQRIVIDPENKIVEAWTEDGGIILRPLRG